MRVLIVSHNCLSPTSNMGKTLLSYFHGFSKADIAQLYFCCEEPVDDSLCCNYYRFTDGDALMSLLRRRPLGRVFGRKDIRHDWIRARVDGGILEGAYQYGRRRTALGYALRELVWSRHPWKTRKFWDWVEEFSPDVVFFASGDYGFSYEIARQIAEHMGAALAICCVDEYYRHNRNGDTLLGQWIHRRFLQTVYRTMDRAGVIFTICDSLQREYETLFSKPCYVLRTAAIPGKQAEGPREGIAYLGNLELGRAQQLVQIGRTLKELNLPGGPSQLDVYSWEESPSTLRDMTQDNGICFHGGVSGEQVQEILGRSMAVVHTESFDRKWQNLTRHSVSTKIPESLMNGPCLIAYGPRGIASMDYLEETGAAWCIHTPEDLPDGLREILTKETLRKQIQTRARETAWKNHSAQIIPLQLRAWLEELCREQGRYEDSANQLCIPPGQHREAWP